MKKRKEPKRSGGRVPADLSQQAPNNSYGPPLYYEDVRFTCRDCGREDVWSAEQQKVYYEKWKKPIHHQATRCRECRRKRRERIAANNLRTQEGLERKAAESARSSPRAYVTVLGSAEEVVRHLEASPPSQPSFRLAIADAFTFAGQPDVMGAGMAVVLDKVLAIGYMPDGFGRRKGFKLYRYRKSCGLG